MAWPGALGLAKPFFTGYFAAMDQAEGIASMDAIVNECLATADAALTTAKRRLTAQLGSLTITAASAAQLEHLKIEQQRVHNALAALQAARAEKVEG
ncbi:MAG: hypothetical protein AAFR93_17490 [Pseudomonadota bacterium]